jgi:hypothetical protein
VFLISETPLKTQTIRTRLVTAIIEQLGFKPVLECACLYTNSRIIIFFYVNNIVIIVHPKYYSNFLDFKAKLMAAYKMRDIGELKWFLGI